MVENRKRLFVASFMTLIVAGLFFGLRASILGDWATQFGFTKSELGAITGGGFVGFGVVILIASALAEKIGYAKLMWVAFVLHVLSAAVTIGATPVYGDGSAGNEAALREVRGGARPRRDGLHLQLRVHLLRRLCRGLRAPLPQLRRRAGRPGASCGGPRNSSQAIGPRPTTSARRATSSLAGVGIRPSWDSSWSAS